MLQLKAIMVKRKKLFSTYLTQVILLATFLCKTTTAIRCWQCAAVDGRRCPEDATLVNSAAHDSCITWRNGNGSILLQNLVRYAEECSSSKIGFWSKFIDLYYQGSGGSVHCCTRDGCNTGVFAQKEDLNRFGPPPVPVSNEKMSDFISQLPAELPGAPLGSFLQQPSVGGNFGPSSFNNPFISPPAPPQVVSFENEIVHTWAA